MWIPHGWGRRGTRSSWPGCSMGFLGCGGGCTLRYVAGEIWVLGTTPPSPPPWHGGGGGGAVVPAPAAGEGAALLLLEREEDEAGRALALLLIQKGFSRVSHVVGGFTALHQHQAHYLHDVLVGHDPELCLVCTGGRSEPALAARGAAAAAAAAAASRRSHLQTGSQGGDSQRDRDHQVPQQSPASLASQWLAGSVSRLLLSPSEEAGRAPTPPHLHTPTLALSDFLRAPPLHPTVAAVAQGAAGGGGLPSESALLDGELDGMGKQQQQHRGFGFSAKPPAANSVKSPPPRLRALSSTLLQALDNALSPPPPGVRK